MKTISVTACLAVLLAAMPVLAGDEATAGADVPLQYAMSVGEDGKVAALTPSRELPDPVDRWIQQQLARYTFQPATVNQQPQPATTTLYLTLGLVVGTDGKPGYRINSVHTGPKLVRGRYASFPREEGAGYFDITFDATGKVTKVVVDETQPFVGGRQFRNWARALAKSFRLQPETVAGHAVPGSGRVPIMVCMDDHCPELPPPHAEDGNDLGGELVAKSVLVPRAPTDG